MSFHDKTPIQVLAEVRDILLPLVEAEENVCGDMLGCTVSNYECIECLAKRIRVQYIKLKDK